MNSPSSSLYILVIAHPDDECMFFIPTLNHFISQKRNRVWVVCLSNGNYNGLGRVREREFKEACRVLGVEKCVCVNVLEDHPTASWSAITVAAALNNLLLEKENENHGISQQVHILTFDEGGVSGHVNHVDTFRGVQYWLSTRQRHFQVTGWKLDTVSHVCIKYIPLFWIPAILVSSLWNGQQQQRYSYWCVEPLLVWKAMATHASQFVWYRRLSVVFSRYTYYNTWTEIIEIKCSHNHHDGDGRKTR